MSQVGQTIHHSLEESSVILCDSKIWARPAALSSLFCIQFPYSQNRESGCVLCDFAENKLDLPNKLLQLSWFLKKEITELHPNSDHTLKEKKKRNAKLNFRMSALARLFLLLKAIVVSHGSPRHKWNNPMFNLHSKTFNASFQCFSWFA